MIYKRRIRPLVLLVFCIALVSLAWKSLSGRAHSRSDSVSLSSSVTSSSVPRGVSIAGSASEDSRQGNTKVADQGFAGVLTYHNDNERIGANLHETVLTPSNVNAWTFGKLYSIPLDGDVYAQPLYVPAVQVPGRGTRDIVYVATENNTVYALDADDPNGSALWRAHLGPAMREQDLPSAACSIIFPKLGITGTPAIDLSTHTLYVVARTFEHSQDEYRLYALDVVTGQQRPGSPVVISATVPGVGDGSVGGKITFDPSLQLQRVGLTLVKDRLFVGFGSNCDIGSFHGWLLAYDTSTLTQIAAFVSTPNAFHGGIWQSGAAPAADPEGNLYIATGDGTFDAASGGSDYGDTFLKLHLGVDQQWLVLDYFTPFDQERMDDLNDDLGSSGPILLPDQPGAHSHLIVSGAKSGTIYLMDRDNMGHFGHEEDPVVQTLRAALPKIDSTAAYWEGLQGRWLYINGVGGPLQQYSVTDGRLSSTPVFQSDELFGYPGSTPAISASGKTDGIAWVVATQVPGTSSKMRAYFHRINLLVRRFVHQPGEVFHKILIEIRLLFRSPSIFWGSLKKLLPNRTPEVMDQPAILRAYDATNISNLLYDSSEAPGNRDRANGPVKFAVPTVANGRVYFGTKNHLEIYGLLEK